MRITPATRVLLLCGLAACAARSEESKETTKVATDTLVESKQVVDTMVVKRKSTIATDTAITADTTIVADTNVTADTALKADTSRLGGGVVNVDTVKVDSTTNR
jgi:hypothetical protein